MLQADCAESEHEREWLSRQVLVSAMPFRIASLTVCSDEAGMAARERAPERVVVVVVGVVVVCVCVCVCV